MHHVQTTGVTGTERTGPGTRSVFGHPMRLDLDAEEAHGDALVYEVPAHHKRSIRPALDPLYLINPTQMIRSPG